MQLPQFEAHADTEDRHWWFTGRRAILSSLIANLLPPSRQTQIVDIGCGTGGLTAFFSTQYACTGIDPDTDAIRLAREKYPDVRFIHGVPPGDCLPALAEADGILLTDVLEHVEEDKFFLQSVIMAAKPGAYLFLLVPADPSMKGPHDAGFGNFRRYTQESFRDLWSYLPVEEKLVSFCNSRLYLPIKLARGFTRIRGKAWGRGDSDIALPSALLNTLLRKIFAGESRHLLAALQGKGAPYNRGVSMVAVLRKT